MKLLGIISIIAAIPLCCLRPYASSLGGFGPGSKFYYGRLLALAAVALGAYLILRG